MLSITLERVLKSLHTSVTYLQHYPPGTNSLGVYQTF